VRTVIFGRHVLHPASSERDEKAPNSKANGSLQTWMAQLFAC